MLGCVSESKDGWSVWASDKHYFVYMVNKIILFLDYDYITCRFFFLTLIIDFSNVLGKNQKHLSHKNKTKGLNNYNNYSMSVAC